MTAPLCVNCCFHEKGRFGLDMCRAPQNLKTDMRRSLVTGKSEEPEWRYDLCETHRADDRLAALMMRTCGKQGRWFQPKAAAENEAA
jgi:hypothetical protein